MLLPFIARVVHFAPANVLSNVCPLSNPVRFIALSRQAATRQIVPCISLVEKERSRSAAPHGAQAMCTILLALLAAAVLSGCNPRGEATGGLDVTILSVTPAPATVGDAEITLRIRDADGNPVEGATVEVEGAMTHAGMQPVIVMTKSLGAGEYVTKGFKFTMGGDWVIIVRATLADGTTAEQRVALKGVQGEMKMDMKSDKAKEGN